MKRGKRYPERVLLYFLLIVLAMLFLSPFLIVTLNSFKPLSTILTDPLSPPRVLHLENYIHAWDTLRLPLILRNSTIVTLCSVCGILLFSTMSAYWMERHPTRYSKLFGALLIGSLLVPFASLMIPLVRVMNILHISNSFLGAILCYWGLGQAFANFIIRGAVCSLPVEMEEAAIIDGCSNTQVFFKVVAPMLTPAVVSVFVLDLFWIWNDFIVPLILLNNDRLLTIQLAINRMFGTYSDKWDIALPGLVMTIAPIVVVFILFQKKIIGGMTAGALKG